MNYVVDMKKTGVHMKELFAEKNITVDDIRKEQDEKNKILQILEENDMTIDQAVDGFLRWLNQDTRAALEWGD